MKDAGLRRRVALVTGANHGIGAATAHALAAAGCDVFIQFLRYRPSDEAGAEQRTHDAAKIVRDITEAGGRARSWETDLAVPANVALLCDRVERDLAPVEILVNNAAVTENDSLDPGEDARDWAGRPKARTTAETVDRNFAVNTRAVALMMAEYARRHVARGESGVGLSTSAPTVRRRSPARCRTARASTRWSRIREPPPARWDGSE